MEFPNLGDHCASHSCNTLDFLPFLCKHCQSVFCKNHYEPTKHNCEPYENETNAKISKDDELNPVAKVPCSKCNRKRVTLEIIKCADCLLNFCYEHRLQEAHSCATLMNEKMNLLARNSKPAPVARIVKEVKVKGTKNDALKLKVALMKLKQKAKGQQSIPESERVYFFIEDKINSSSCVSHEYFLCKHWSIGRCVSYLADELKIKNNNDKSDCDRLVLKLSEDAVDYLPFERSIEEFIIKDQCSNGQQLTICYHKNTKSN